MRAPVASEDPDWRPRYGRVDPKEIERLRTLGEALRWENDRVAMALFAHMATPQIRLTKDPNTYFFFLDHLRRESPFPLRDDTTWDTNIELGLHWGTRLVDKDEELNGASPNGKALVLVSDGQAWSGEVAEALRHARAAEEIVNRRGGDRHDRPPWS